MGLLWPNQLMHRINHRHLWMAVLVTRIRSSLLKNGLSYSESWYPPLIMELDMMYLPIPFLESQQAQMRWCTQEPLKAQSIAGLLVLFQGRCLGTHVGGECVRISTKGGDLFCKEDLPGIRCSKNFDTQCSHSSTLYLIINYLGDPFTVNSL